MTLWEVMYANEAVETMAGVEEEPGLQNMAGVSQDRRGKAFHCHTTIGG